MAKHRNSKKHLANSVEGKVVFQENPSGTETVDAKPGKRYNDKTFAEVIRNPYNLDIQLSSIYNVDLLSHNQYNLNSLNII
ncbi:MAG: hypothetical protein AAGG81_08660 [Chlamydiota bacterium]